jgi:hypothetical protein
MERRHGYFILLGLLIGTFFGIGIGVATENIIRGIGLGALAGVFVGWFLAAAVLENRRGRG